MEPGATLDAVIGATSDGIVCIDESLVVVLFNQASLALVEAEPDDLVGHPFVPFVHEEDRDSVLALLAELGGTDMASLNFDRPFCFRLARASGQPLAVEATVTQTVTESQRLYTFFMRDVSDQVEARQRVDGLATGVADQVVRLQRTTERLTLLQAYSDFLQSCLTLEEAYTETARFGRRMFPDGGALAVSDPRGGPIRVVSNWGQAVDSGTFVVDDCFALRRGQPHQSRLGDQLQCLHLPDGAGPSLCLPLMARGECLGVLRLVRPVDAPPMEGDDREFVLAVADALKLRLANLRIQEALKERAIPDPLTGLLRRASFVEVLRLEIDRARQSQSALSVVTVQLPRPADEAAQKSLANVIRDTGDSREIHGRLDEGVFGIGLPEARAARALARAHEVLDEARRAMPSQSGLSIGVASLREHGETVAELVDAALSAGRSASRGRQDEPA